MSPQEPQSPTDYSNAKKHRVKDTEEVERPPIEKVVSGEVIVHKRSIGRKLKDLFIAADPKTVALYVAMEVLLPAAKNMVYDAWTKGGARMMFGESAMRRQMFGQQFGGPFNSPLTPKSLITYNRPELFRQDPRLAPPIPIGPRSSVRTGHENITIASKEDADMVLERLNDIIDTYQVVSLAELKELLGLPIEHTDNKFGWVSLVGVQVLQVRNGYVIDLPPADVID